MLQYTIFLILIVFNVFLLFVNMQTRQYIEKAIALKEEQIKNGVAAAREAIINDVSGKYRAQMESFAALAKEMKIQRSKRREMEEKFKK